MLRSREEPTPQEPSEPLNVDRAVDEALHKLSPRYERLLRSRFEVSDPHHAPKVQEADRAQLHMALRALRRLVVSTAQAR